MTARKASTAPEQITCYVVRAYQGVRLIPPRGAAARTAADNPAARSAVLEVTVPRGQLLPEWVPADYAEHLAAEGLAERLTLPRHRPARPTRVRPPDDPAAFLTASTDAPVRVHFVVTGAAIVFRTRDNAGMMLYRGASVPETIHPDDRDNLEAQGLIARRETPLTLPQEGLTR